MNDPWRSCQQKLRQIQSTEHAILLSFKSSRIFGTAARTHDALFLQVPNRHEHDHVRQVVAPARFDNELPFKGRDVGQMYTANGKNL